MANTNTNESSPSRPVFIVVFDCRAGDGSHVVGPFQTREQAHTWASLDTAGGDASWEVWAVEPPENKQGHAHG